MNKENIFKTAAFWSLVVTLVLLGSGLVVSNFQPEWHALPEPLDVNIEEDFIEAAGPAFDPLLCMVVSKGEDFTPTRNLKLRFQNQVEFQAMGYKDDSSWKLTGVIESSMPKNCQKVKIHTSIGNTNSEFTVIFKNDTFWTKWNPEYEDQKTKTLAEFVQEFWHWFNIANFAVFLRLLVYGALHFETLWWIFLFLLVAGFLIALPIVWLGNLIKARLPRKK